MEYPQLERRTAPRTQAFVPVTLRFHDAEENTPAHLLDLSADGAGILTTVYNAPALGQYLDLRFETSNSDGGSESGVRQETGIVVNIRPPERGIARAGIQFLQHRDSMGEVFDPKEILSTYRKRVPAKEQWSRWETARSFETLSPCPSPTAAN